MPRSRFCKTFTPKNLNAPYQGISLRGVVLDRRLWKAFHKLTVAFLDDMSKADRWEYITVIREWASHINLSIVFTSDPKADIRIKTEASLNSSAIGTDALLVDPADPTMYIADKPNTEFFRSAVLHEFGHALGFQHEHLHPDINIPWNKPKVYEYYMEEEGWSRESVDQNIFNQINEPMTVTAYDSKSIMHYPIDKDLTDGVFEVGENMELSEKDKHLARSVYPR